MEQAEILKLKKSCTHQCTCACHKEGQNMIHITACCDGQCEFCGLFIKFGKVKEHLKECHNKV